MLKYCNMEIAQNFVIMLLYISRHIERLDATVGY